MTKITIIVLGLMAVLNGIQAQCKLDYTNYHLVLSEDFNNTSITQLSNYWQFTPIDPGFGWGDPVCAPNIPGDGEYYDPSQVSLISGGYLRLTAVKLSNPTPIWSNWLGKYRNCTYKSGMIRLKKDVSGYPFDPTDSWCSADYGGFKYGMFEIRMKIPEGVTFPAFWLAGPSQLNVFEGKFDERKYGVGFSNFWTNYDGRYVWRNKLNWDDLSDDFHT